MRRDGSCGSLSSFSRDGAAADSPGLNLTDDMADRILLDSTSSDSTSLHSAGRSFYSVSIKISHLLYVTVLCIFSLSLSPGSSIVTTASTTSAPAEEGGVAIRQQSRRKKMLSSSRRRQSRVPNSSQEEGEGEKREERSQRSVPTTPDSVSMDLGRDGTEVSESSSGTPKSPVSRMASAPEATPPKAQGAKVRLSGSYSVPLTVIEEPVGETEVNEQGLTPGEEEERERLQIQRSPSPCLQVPPSPVRGFSPNSSPRNTRRIATRRTRSNRRESHNQFL